MGKKWRRTTSLYSDFWEYDGGALNKKPCDFEYLYLLAATPDPSD